MATRVALDGGRAPLQASTVERLRTSSGDQIPVWLLVVDPGHLRVFAENDAPADLAALMSADPLAIETRQEREQVAALRMRLVASKIDKERRLTIPAEAFDISAEYLDRSHVWVDQSSPHLDIYTASYVQRVLVMPPSQFLPVTFQSKPGGGASKRAQGARKASKEPEEASDQA